jgi:rare lipoprotein A
MRFVILVTLLAVALTGCAHKRRTRVSSAPASRAGRRAPAAQPPPGSTETGIASWYGVPYHGRPAANGEIYDMEKLTAAHRTLSFNTWVRVENLANHKTVEVRITDRGPFIDGRIIDLSHAAASSIDLIGPGTARVRLEILRGPTVPEAAVFAVQVGAYRDRASAERMRAQMEASYGAARLVFREGNPNVWRVLVGAESSEDAATALAGRIQAESGEKNAFVVRLDS